MKNYKNILKSLFLLLLMLTISVSCNNDDEYIPPGSFTDLSITMTSGAAAVREAEVNGFFSFSDISAGAQSTSWTIPDTSFFLEGPIPNNLTNHDDYIIEDANRKSSGEKTVHVMFKKGNSDTKIKYRGVFLDSTSFIFPAYWDADLNTAVEDTIKTVRVNDKWVAEYWFSIDVYDTVLATPQVRYLDETILDHTNTNTVTVNFGDKMIFEDLSGMLTDNNARPNTTLWRMHSIEENEEDQENVLRRTSTRVELEEPVIDTLTFSELGEFRVELTATRERTENLKISQDIYDIPTIFKVVSLTDPLTQIGNVLETDMNVVEITLSHKIIELESSVLNNFKVEVDGVEKTITSVARNANGTKLLINLDDDPILPTDDGKMVTVSYDGSASDILQSFDARPLEAFTDVAIEVYVPTPVILTGEIMEAEDETIQVIFDQEINPDTLGANATDGFEVLVNGIGFSIASISLNSSDASILDIVLNDPIYNSDAITVSYDGSGSIQSIGEGAVQAFTAQSVTPFINNLLENYGSFEGTLGDNWIEGASGTGAIVEFTTEQVHSGNQSLKMTNDKPRLENIGANTLSYEAGKTYIISYWRYIPSTVVFDNGFRAGDAGLKIWFMLGTSNAAVTPRWFANVDPVQDTWEYVEAEFTPGATSNSGLRLQPVPTSGTEYTLYYDDFMIYEKEAR